MNKPAPFTINQKEWFDRALASWLNVAEGGKRGGKNVLATLADCVKIETHPNKLHLVGGVSIATAKLNILDCDGFGMLNYFEGRCKEGKYKNRDCLYVQTITGEKVILVSGGGKDGDQKLIQGNTYGTAYITEANLCHPNFIKEVFDRTLSSSDRWICHDLNPKAPNHWYYTDVLAFHEEQQKLDPGYGYNFGHFTIADNMSISDEKLKQILATYDKKSVWYKRDIKGQRQAAEGLIYGQFAEQTDSFIIDKAPDDIIMINVGVDFGGNGSAHAFIANGITRNLRSIVTLDEYYRKEIITPKQLDADFVKFINQVHKDYAKIPRIEVNCDSEATVLIQGLKIAAVENKLPVEIRNALKGPITDRISFYNSIMAQGRYKVMRKCKHLISAFQEAIWDPKKQPEDVRLDDGTINIDSLDACEYTTERLQRDIQQMALYKTK